MKSKRNRKEEVDDENNESAVVTETVMEDNSSGNALEPKQVPEAQQECIRNTFLSASSGASNNGIPGMGQSTATQQSQPSHTPVGLTPGTTTTVIIILDPQQLILDKWK